MRFLLLSLLSLTLVSCGTRSDHHSRKPTQQHDRILERALAR